MNIENFPDWYWVYGLHDAEIKRISFQTLDYDYTQKNPIRNYLLVELDSCNALFDTTITSIKFYNAKIIRGTTDLSGYWWMSDELTFDKKKYLLVIYVSSIKEKTSMHISFDTAEVFRNG